MTQAPPIIGATLQVYVPPHAIGAARDFYTALFGREPDFQPHDDFLEWAPLPGQECWIQLTARAAAGQLTNRLRLRVADIDAAVTWLDRTDVSRSEVSHLPGVVAFVDFTDPWENRLGYYQDLVPSGEQVTYPGTSVSDESLFSPGSGDASTP